MNEPRSSQVLFISNGHGEDLNAAQVVKVLQQQHPDVEIGAMPIVGQGNAYRSLGVKIIGPTENLPSGGFVYVNKLRLLDDIRSGLLTLLWRQIQAIRDYGKNCDAVMAIGDAVPIVGAYLTGKPFMAFIVSTSAYYEQRIKLPFPTNVLLKSERCGQIFTRDRYTAKLLNESGYTQAIFVGYPTMDALETTDKDLQLRPNLPMVAFLPGSRLPEAGHNLQLLLELAIATTPLFPDGIQFCAAITPNIRTVDRDGDIPIERVAARSGWEYRPDGYLIHPPTQIQVRCFDDAFADILERCDLVAGMAGNAIEQAVGLGKPIIQIPGAGPQFNYPFAEAQMRLLGLSVQTIGTKPADAAAITEAARAIHRTLQDAQYLQQCRANGMERVGGKGGNIAMAKMFADRFLPSRMKIE